jgi:hypothetical protein
MSTAEMSSWSSGSLLRSMGWGALVAALWTKIFSVQQPRKSECGVLVAGSAPVHVLNLWRSRARWTLGCTDPLR